MWLKMGVGGQGGRWGVTEVVKERARETRARRELSIGTQKRLNNKNSIQI